MSQKPTDLSRAMVEVRVWSQQKSSGETNALYPHRMALVRAFLDGSKVNPYDCLLRTSANVTKKGDGFLNPWYKKHVQQVFWTQVFFHPGIQFTSKNSQGKLGVTLLDFDASSEPLAWLGGWDDRCGASCATLKSTGWLGGNRTRCGRKDGIAHGSSEHLSIYVFVYCIAYNFSYSSLKDRTGIQVSERLNLAWF